MKAEKDPIDHIRDMLIDGKHATENELKVIDKNVKKIVSEAADFASESPEPALDQLFTDVYA